MEIERDTGINVVPHAGTWIEMSEHLTKTLRKRSVVPHAGTWIEIGRVQTREDRRDVVPHAGTWIEIIRVSQYGIQTMSFPTRERGLKSNATDRQCIKFAVVPHAGTWIEIQHESGFGQCQLRSFPTRERGLKL